jgi:hypothetical protein
MKKITTVFIYFIMACSPYKKIVINNSQIQTDHWINQTETSVIAQLGQFKTKKILESGYMLLFDYSTYRRTPANSYNGPSIQAGSSNQVGGFNRQIIPPTNYVTTSAKPALDNNQFELVKQRMLEFYFDKNKNVMYVNAFGYPDSIRYELRKK